MTKILMTGVTGYIGGAILTRFMQRSDFSSLDIRAVVRSSDKAKRLKEYGITPIVGSHDDLELMEKAAQEVDVVIAMADCDDVVAAEALKKTGKRPIYINTSGTGVLADNADGMYASTTIYDDADSDQINSLHPSQPHRPVDLAIVNADAEGFVKAYIILPTHIWNTAQGPLFDSGISNPQSILIPSLIRASLDRGQGGMAGKGLNIWNNVEIHELADLYSLVFDATLSETSSLPHGRDGYIFGITGEHSLYQVCKAVAQAMVRVGKGKSEEPTSFTKEEIDKYFSVGGYAALSTNSRGKPTRGAALGWAPKKTTEDMLANINLDLEIVIKNLADSRL
ncbi:hypothetical protein BDP27DRAFT_1383066 [Rhodocollybia butyracea]|uniref:NmrA-like domain-containing protein n=1 Tax=Rhodocollybia butyracea TaxID=206335 RepID=A0A9P5PWB7_9AGAR|nr:hypothetical protein BDP27DRAFT_1383066 [Rhodocollybia butyracea]